MSNFLSLFSCQNNTSSLTTLCFLIPFVPCAEVLLSLLLKYPDINLLLKRCDHPDTYGISNKQIQLFVQNDPIKTTFNHYFLCLKLNNSCDAEHYKNLIIPSLISSDFSMKTEIKYHCQVVKMDGNV